MSVPVHLTVLDLIPRASGQDRNTVLRNTVDLVQQAERLGYRRYWFAEHHLNTGVLGASPAVSIALVAQATERIRLGSAAVQFGHRTPLATVEEFGLIEALYPGRIDLGIGRSISRPQPTAPDSEGGGEAEVTAAKAVAAYLAGHGTDQHEQDSYTDSGLLLPRQYSPGKGLAKPRLAPILNLLQQPGAWAPDYDQQIAQVQDLIAGTFATDGDRTGGGQLHASSAEGADLELWIFGTSAGTSAAIAGNRGLRFAAGYHHTPSTAVDAVEAYRAAFRPSAELSKPYVAVSVDVVAADTEDRARELASGFAPWVRGIRRGDGAIAYPSPEEAAAETWTDEERELVRDRVVTQFVGTPGQVADKLEQLQQATGAQEIAITTSTHDHADRVRSYQLVAEEWDRRQG